VSQIPGSKRIVQPFDQARIQLQELLERAKAARLRSEELIAKCGFSHDRPKPP
jgi:hypothetical protein